ncbi:hypothetical protein [Gordonia sp. (in: high G+C Gram-positive bacteria)]|jgi:hypothetical protein|uniref:hypothetical protein n=1 Tax=Gordonia sp. (in: high G+C Gram-positive bacteria) TaxID=84139 RepID=UPI001DF1326A|nr:hypothetical protein [Gordonia sp. (in: high G+C Gram-positive bacteria)]MCB1296387.1 hypothetical protein [Gordonia sp. (in: high G+C Gram-positive bacteria)]HMS74421.1 hypothetical protein [Gordonia sp. (in: high G+C Gram-positive bacteria)]HQV19971.1 hypothetical protein [Gordonia sp. (in: high G+C Gram-positive bacteria)]
MRPTKYSFSTPSGRIPPARLRGTPPSDPLLPDPDLAPLLQADPVVKHETITLPGGRLIGIDPGHTEFPSLPWRAFIMDATTVTVPGIAADPLR